MVRLMLLRHGKSSRPDGVDDHHRPLSKRGRKDSKSIGRYMLGKDLVPDEVIASTASRTQETWYLARSGKMKQAICRADQRVYDAAADTLLDVIRETSDEVKNLIVVGHNPGIAELALGMCAVDKSGRRARLEKKLPTAGLVIIDFDAQGWSGLKAKTGELTKFVTPNTISR